MKSLLIASAFLGVMLFGLAGCDSTSSMSDSGHASASACTACTAGKAGQTVWCDSCNAGFVAGKMTACHDCYVAAKTGGECAKCAAKKAH